MTLRFDGLAIPAGEVVLALPHVINNVDTVATVLSDLTTRNRVGSLALSVRDADRPDGKFAVREWVTPRATQGPIAIRYTVPAGHMFVLLPPQAGTLMRARLPADSS